jgi:predicted HD phosphohydrolase
MIHDLGEDPARAGLDDRHEELGHAWLAQHFGREVSEPVRLHSAAKRYLCATEADYFTKLSADSVRNLELQGGPTSLDEVAEFRRSPHAMAAVRLRRYDEMAKVANLDTPGVSHFLPHVHRSLERSD